MTSAEFIAREKKYYNWLITKATPFKQSVYNIVALQANRIFEQGKNSADTKMKSPNGGVYDSKQPLYVNQKLIKGGSKLGKPKGKSGKTKFKNGKEHKLNYLESYKDLRSKLGRRTDVVNLQLSYDLFSDWAGSPKASDWTQPKKYTPRQVSVYEYNVQFSRAKNRDKADGLEDRYGSIFKMTPKERKEFYRTLNFNFEQSRQKFYATLQEPQQ